MNLRGTIRAIVWLMVITSMLVVAMTATKLQGSFFIAGLSIGVGWAGMEMRIAMENP